MNQTNGDSRFGRKPIPKTGGQDYREVTPRNLTGGMAGNLLEAAFVEENQS